MNKVHPKPRGMIIESYLISCMDIKKVRKTADKFDIVLFQFSISTSNEYINVELTKREIESSKDSQISGRIIREWLKLCEEHDRCLTFIDVIGVKMKK